MASFGIVSDDSRPAVSTVHDVEARCGSISPVYGWRNDAGSDFDDSEIASWASVWSYAMEEIGKASKIWYKPQHWILDDHKKIYLIQNTSTILRV